MKFIQNGRLYWISPLKTSMLATQWKAYWDKADWIYLSSQQYSAMLLSAGARGQGFDFVRGSFLENNKKLPNLERFLWASFYLLGLEIWTLSN